MPPCWAVPTRCSWVRTVSDGSLGRSRFTLDPSLLSWSSRSECWNVDRDAYASLGAPALPGTQRARPADEASRDLGVKRVYGCTDCRANWESCIPRMHKSNLFASLTATGKMFDVCGLPVVQDLKSATEEAEKLAQESKQARQAAEELNRKSQAAWEAVEKLQAQNPTAAVRMVLRL